jgi:hypothetical protein
MALFYYLNEKSENNEQKTSFRLNLNYEGIIILKNRKGAINGKWSISSAFL